MNAFTNTIREIWDQEQPNACIRIAGLTDGVRLHTPDPKSHEYFGAFDVEISADIAIELGHALIAAAQDSKDFANRLAQ
jgi:hypothetical protein